MKLDGFGTAGYRRFGPGLVHIKDLGNRKEKRMEVLP
jgi:hypothetical protein